MSMFVEDGRIVIYDCWQAVVEIENNVFTKSLTSTTMQDGSTRERSDVVGFYLYG